MSGWLRHAVVLIGVLVGGLSQAAVNRDPLQIVLREPVAKKAAAPATEAARGLDLRIDDGRGTAAGSGIGHGSNDGEALFPISASNAVTPFVEAIARRTLAGWNIDAASGADGTLRLRYTRLEVDAQAHAVGATYVGAVRLDWALLNRAGHEVSRGSAEGGMQHYGRSRSADNINEALAGALQAALGQLATDPAFRKLWDASFQSEGAPPPPAAPATPARRVKAAAPATRADKAEETPSSAGQIMQRLRKLDELHERKAITREEYDKRRAAIIDEI